MLINRSMTRNVRRCSVETLESRRLLSGSGLSRTPEAAHSTITLPPQLGEVLVHAGSNFVQSGSALPSQSNGTDFGSTPVGTPISITYTVANIGSTTLATSNLQVPAGFSVVEGLSASIAQGSSDTFTVQVDAGTQGTYVGDLRFQAIGNLESDFSFVIAGVVGAGSGFGGSVLVTGNSVPIAINDYVPASVDATLFSWSLVGTSVIRTFTVQNNGASELTTGNLTVPADFSVLEALNTSISPGGSDTFTVLYNPTDPTDSWGLVSFTTSAPETPVVRFAISARSGVSSERGVDLSMVGNVTGVKPGSFVAGSKGGTLKVAVQNQGVAFVTGVVTVRFYASSDSIVDPLDAPIGEPVSKNVRLANGGKQTTFSAKLIYPQVEKAGDYFILAKVDPENAISERNEFNNTAAAPMVVGIGPATVDLTGGGITVKGRPVPGRPAAAQLTIRNLGNVASKSMVGIKVFASPHNDADASDDVLLFEGSIPVKVAANAAQKRSVRFTLPSSLTPGTYAGIVVIDPASAVVESDETNNTLAAPELLVLS